MAAIKVRITHYPEAQHAHKWRYAIMRSGRVLVTSEGYPTHQHVTRAFRGFFNGMAELFGVPGTGAEHASMDPASLIPFTKDSAPAPTKVAK